MKLLLRKIRLNRWVGKPASLSDEHVQELLQELVPTNNRLSVYQVDGDTEIEMAIVGLASNMNEVNKVEYILIDAHDIEAAGFQLEESSGTTPHTEANLLHRDLVIPTEDKISDLIKILHTKGNKLVKLKPEVEALLKDAQKNNKFDITKMKHKLHLKLSIQCSC